MDFESLGKALISDTLDEDDFYVRLQDRGETVIGNDDFVKAKSFLSTVNPRLNISLYDHLADVLKSILRSKIPDAVDEFEKLSLLVKNLRQKGDDDLTELFEIGEELQAYIAEKQVFYKFKMSVPEPPETTEDADDDDDDESDDEDEDVAEEVISEELVSPDLAEVLPDVHHIMSRFHQAGIGLSYEEEFELSLSLKDLAIQFKLSKLRFWGKVFGLENDYYVAEAPYQEGVAQEQYGWQVAEESKAVPEEISDEEDNDKEEEEDEEKAEDDEEKEEDAEGTEAVKIPPIPEPREKAKRRVPPEPNGTGINENLYFACTKIGQPWRVLPFVMPSHVTEARYLKRFFSGNLDSQIRGCVPYPGKEAHYLRAQIARITASTFIAPIGFYKKAGEKDEDDENEDEEDEESGIGQLVPNLKFEPKAVKYMYSGGLSEWCHGRKAVLDQGRCIPMKLKEKGDEEDDEAGNDDADEDGDDEEGELEEEPEILEAIVETEVPLLRSITEDKGIGRLKPWTWKLSSKLMEEKAVLLMCSSLWPGAYTYYDGKEFEHIYIGHGYKYSVFHYAPIIRVASQREYQVGDDVTEDVDEEIFPKDETEAKENAEDEEKEDDDEKEDDGEKEEEEDDD